MAQESTALLRALLPERLRAAVPCIEPYWLTSFGSFVRMDYGTGHETSFALFLLCLTLLRFLKPEPAVERQVVLDLFVRYLRLCWRLQDVYKLEPAGSHGVWGLDDYNFLSYVFGSAQLRGRDVAVCGRALYSPLGTLRRAAVCRSKGDRRVRRATPAAPPDEPVLSVDHADTPGQVRAVPRALVAAALDRDGRAALAQGALGAVQNVRGTCSSSFLRARR